MSLKIWVQPAGPLWNVKFQGNILRRSRSFESALEDARDEAKIMLNKEKENVELVIEHEGSIRTENFVYDEPSV